MYEIIFDGGYTNAIVLKDGTKVYQGDADEAQEYVLEQLDVNLEQSQEEFEKYW